ncbi:hypothetical protein ASPCAL02356 [Aspergillus calidoustus]|uniref:Major facilitator superfamily (MFS) profile domain-containing protein n=1 Tax=Aspergillus calidoustus TaxID=454130 RepID=A0A0U5GML1_ASPCI|nr:hypothetical protein ASPCAL02356 [Aspergillus calidoustus]
MAINRQAAAEKALHDQTNILPRGRLLIVFAGLAISLFISFVDQNGISVTLPTIAEDLNGKNTISWAGTSSLIANTMFSVLYGRLSDIFGRKIVYLSALALLCIADLLCSLSQNAAMFYVFRGLAGVAGGGIGSLAMIIVSDVVTLQQRGKYQGILGASLGVANVVGPFIAAAFILRATWRGFFWMLSPLAACSIVVGYFLIPDSARKDSFRANLKRIDYFGIIASSIGIIFLLIPISGGGSYFEWNSPMVIMEFFKNRVIVALFLQSFLLGAVYQAYLYYLPLYYQNARGWSPVVSAALTAPMVACQSISSVLSGQYISRFKRYGEVIWLGFGIWTLGAGLTLLFNKTTHPAVIAVIVAITGLGIGCTFQPTLVAFQAHCTKRQRAVVISNRNFFRCLGGACGLAISGAVLQATLRSHLPSGYAHLSDSTYTLPARESVSPELWKGIVDAYTQASKAVFILQVPLIGVAFLACLLIKDHGLERPKDADEIAQEEERKKEESKDEERQLNGDVSETTSQVLTPPRGSIERANEKETV